MKKCLFDLSFSILLFLFCIFALNNICFLFNLKVNLYCLTVSLIVSLFYLFKTKNFIKKTLILFLIFLISFILANLFIDTSFDGRCYHFTTENLFKLGFNPIFDDIKFFANNNNIYFNLLFSSSYPNALELIRSNFYLLFNNFESSKIVNFLSCFSLFFYCFYFFSFKNSGFKAFILSFCTILCAVNICQINTKMNDFFVYHLFVFQVLSLYLTDKNKDIKTNKYVFIMSSVLSIATKYIGLFNTVIIFLIFMVYKFIKKQNLIPFLKTVSIVFFLSCFLCIQPYILNLIKFKNPFYPSFGFNKIDFMTKQNPKEFLDKHYLYKFLRSMFSSASDSRISDPKTPRLYYKIPFTTRFDMPIISEDIRISGFGHLFSGIFIISLFCVAILLKKKKGILVFSIILFTTFLNPICWWARFVSQLYLLGVFVCYYLRKNKILFYFLSFLITINGLWILKENLYATAYKTYIINSFYNELYEKSKNKDILIYKDKTPKPEDDETVIFRLGQYGINYTLVYDFDKTFKELKNEYSISRSYKIKID